MKAKKFVMTAFLTRYRFLIRLIAFGLLLLLVLSLSSTVVISNHSVEQLMEMNATTIHAAARSVDDTMQSHLQIFDEIGRSFIESPHTYEQNIRSAKLTSSLPTAPFSFIDEQLKGYSMSMPLLSGMCIYYHASHSALYAQFPSSGPRNITSYWGSAKVYYHLLVSELDETEFFVRLNELTKPAFYASDALLEKGRMLYLLPVSINPTVDARRVIIFDISAASFQKLFSTILPSHTTVEALSWQGQLIYHQPGEETARRFTHENASGFSVTVSMPEAEYASLFSGFSASILRLGVFSVLLCGVLIAMFVVFSYQPLNHIVQFTGMERTTDEVSAVNDYVIRKEQLANELRAELENEKELARLRQVEMLLLGLPCVSHSHAVLAPALPYHFAAVSPLGCFPAINEAIRTLKGWKHVTAFEQYRSGYLVMVVGAAEPDSMIESFKASFEEAFGPDVQLGTGSVCAQPEQLHRSYLEAILTLNGVPGQMSCEDQLDPANILKMEEFETFRAQIIANDSSCLQTLETMFARLDTLEPSLFLYWHCHYQLLERVSSLLREYGYPMAQRKQLLMPTQDAREVRQQFVQTVAELLAAGPQDTTSSEQELGEAIVLFIHRNLDNELFSITDISESFNLSEYTISRLVKERTDLNFKKYLTEVRLDKAKELLGTSSLSIQDVALQCGFSSSSYFIRVFKANVQLTPLQYRHSVQEA